MKFEIQGMADLEAALAKLSLVSQRKVLTKAVKAGGEIIRAEAAEQAPEVTGRLKKEEIMSQAGLENTVDEVRVHIGPSKKAFYGSYDELGTSKQAAKPFLGPSFETKKDEALDATKLTLAGEIYDALK